MIVLVGARSPVLPNMVHVELNTSRETSLVLTFEEAFSYSSSACLSPSCALLTKLTCGVYTEFSERATGDPPTPKSASQYGLNYLQCTFTMNYDAPAH